MRERWVFAPYGIIPRLCISFVRGSVKRAGRRQAGSRARRAGWLLTPSTPVNSSALTALSRTSTTARVRCCQRRVAAHVAVSVVHGQSRPSAANRPETEGYGAKCPPSRAFIRLRIVFELSIRREKTVQPRHRFGGGDSHDQAAPVTKAQSEGQPWLNQIEIWFSILAGRSLKGASFLAASSN